MCLFQEHFAPNKSLQSIKIPIRVCQLIRVKQCTGQVFSHLACKNRNKWQKNVSRIQRKRQEAKVCAAGKRRLWNTFFHLVTKAYKKDGWRYNEASNTLQHGNKLLLPSVWYPDRKAEDQPARLQQAVWARFFRLATASLLGSLNVHAASVSVRSSP